MPFPKLRDLIGAEDIPEFIRACHLRTYGPASSVAVAELRARYAWIDDRYIELLQISNGLTLEQFSLHAFGHGDDDSFDRFQFIAREYGNDKYAVIGFDGAGDAVLVGEDGRIYLVCSDPPPEEPELLCDSIEVLIEDICLGAGYAKHCGPVGDYNEWWKMLQSRGYTTGQNSGE